VDNEEAKKYFPPALDRALDILELISTSHTALSMLDISKALGIPYASTFRAVKCLVSRGYLTESHENAEALILGYKIQQLAETFNNVDTLYAFTQPLISELAEQTQQAVQINVLCSDSIMEIKHALPISPIKVIVNSREKMPVNQSASAKILMALMDKDEFEIFFNKAWKKITNATPHSITNKARFKNEIENCKKKGYGLDLEEYALEIGCAAVPIYDFSEKPISAIGLTGFINNYTNEATLKTNLELLRQCAEKISRQLGYQGHIDIHI